MTVLGCKWHPSADNVGVCAHCLRESLSRLAVYQDEEDDSIDLEIFPPSMPSSGMPTGSSRAQQFMLVQYAEDGSHGGLVGDNSDLFYPGVNRNGRGGNINQHDHEPTDGHDHVDMQGEVSTSEDSGSGGQDEVPPQADPGKESGRNKRKLHASSGKRKPKSWGSAMMKMVGFRTLRVLLRSETKKADGASSSSRANNKPHDHGFEGTSVDDLGAHNQQFTPTRFSVSSALEQTTMTPHRYSVSSQWEQTTPTRYHEQITPSRYSGASLFDIESMDSRRFSTSSRSSPFAGGRPVINNENFNAAWRASKSGTHGRKMGVYVEGFGREDVVGSKGVVVQDASGKSPAKSPAKSPMKSPWKWFSSFKSVAVGSATSSRKAVATPLEPIPAAPVSPYQERRKSTSSMPVGNPKPRDSHRQPLTPVLTSKKSPWWKSSPAPRNPKKSSPLMIPAKAGHRDQEVATDSQDDTPHRLSSASPMVGYSRSSSNGSSCFTTPRWNNNNRTRSQHGTRSMAAHEREHEITHLAI